MTAALFFPGFWIFVIDIESLGLGLSLVQYLISCFPCIVNIKSLDLGLGLVKYLISCFPVSFTCFTLSSPSFLQALLDVCICWQLSVQLPLQDPLHAVLNAQDGG